MPTTSWGLTRGIENTSMMATRGAHGAEAGSAKGRGIRTSKGAAAPSGALVSCEKRFGCARAHLCVCVCGGAGGRGRAEKRSRMAAARLSRRDAGACTPCSGCPRSVRHRCPSKWPGLCRCVVARTCYDGTWYTCIARVYSTVSVFTLNFSDSLLTFSFYLISIFEISVF